MARSPGGSPKARHLGAELRKAREDASMSANKLAQMLEVARARLQRWENGTTVPEPAEVAAYLALIGVNGAERDRLVELAEDVDASNWITSDVSGIRTELTTLIEFERTCTRMVDVSPLIVPGLLQTADYIRAVMSNVQSSETEKLVLLRLGRQNILTQRRSAPDFSTYVAEGVLREPIGGPEVMADQLAHILTMAKRSNVHVRVIRSGAQAIHVAHAGPFVLFEFPKAAPIVHLEHYRSSGFLYNARDVADYARAEDQLRAVALSGDDSLKLIAEIATEMERNST